MVNQKLVPLLNDWQNLEMYSSNLYRVIANNCAMLNLDGFSHWHTKQSDEELTHYDEVVAFMTDSNVQPVANLANDMAGKVSGVREPIESFTLALEHERRVYDAIKGVCDMAYEVKQHDAYALSQKFLLEQVEEINTLEAILARAQLVGGLALLEQELGKR